MLLYTSRNQCPMKLGFIPLFKSMAYANRQSVGLLTRCWLATTMFGVVNSFSVLCDSFTVCSKLLYTWIDPSSQHQFENDLILSYLWTVYAPWPQDLWLKLYDYPNIFQNIEPRKLLFWRVNHLPKRRQLPLLKFWQFRNARIHTPCVIDVLYIG